MTEQSNVQVKRTEELLKLLDLPNIDALAGAIARADPALDRTDLQILHAGESAGKTRKGALDAISAAAAMLPAANEAGQKARIEQARGRLLMFKPGDAIEGADPAAVARTGPSFLVLGDGEREIAGLSRIAAHPGQFTMAGKQVMFGRQIDVAGVAIDTAIRAVALIDEDGAVHGVCAIPGALPLGGRHVQLPAGSLIFG